MSRPGCQRRIIPERTIPARPPSSHRQPARHRPLSSGSRPARNHNDPSVATPFTTATDGLAYRTAGTRAQAPPATLAERHGRRGSQATWSRTLPFPAAVPAGCGPLRGKSGCDLLWRLAEGDGLMGVQLGLMGFNSAARSSGPVCEAAAAVRELPPPSDTLAQSSDLRRRLCARSYEESEQLIFAGEDHGGSSRAQISER
jgi:hypothetical protein